MMQMLQHVLCASMTLIFAETPYTVQLIPKGNCLWCCPILKEDIKLYFFTENQYPSEENYFHPEDWQRSSWLRNNRTIVIYVHGFTEQATGPAATLVKEAYMTRNAEYLIAVDWRNLAALPWYDHAVSNTHYVAVYIANFIDNLVMRGGVPLERIHVIGFSLGAEIAGLVGKMVRSGKLTRITGLDPAYPLYHGAGPRGRLDKRDAKFVDVIHTDGGELGFATPLGHADFYPNGGKPHQPGCKLDYLLRTGRIMDIVACSHNRAWKYYAESVKAPYDFPAIPCPSYQMFKLGKCHGTFYRSAAYMGYIADPSLRGNFFLETESTQPFGGRHFKG
ncbi:pancreatic lipase-related protein 2 isoform X2 [Rhodnius prolixus]|uniref:pancreatic lipase-related protein 2 isoform X2 n=1 Tax=Rhodnius prolixus TaxID=13249 RepID=UPI003D18E9D7